MPKQAVDASSKFKIFETNEFQKCIKKLSAIRTKLVLRKLSEYIYPQLRKDPFIGPNIKKLKGYEPSTWRYRIVSLRVFYIVDQKQNIVSILSIHDRRDAYR